MKMPSLSMLRWVFLFCVALDLMLLKGLATRSAPVPIALLFMYGILALWATTNLDDSSRIALRKGTFLGLVSGVTLTVWTTRGYFLWLNGIAPVLGSTSVAIALACWSMAGYLAARRTASASSGWLAGCWGGVVCALLKVTFSLLLLRTPPPGVSLETVLAVAGRFLLEGPVIGAALGAIAGLAARIRGTIVLHRIGLAGGK